MFRRSVLLSILFIALPAGATDYILPVFALRVPGEGGSLWTSEVWVTNPGSTPVTVREGPLIGRTTGAPPCLPLVQPSLEVEPYSTKVWPIGELALGIGCPQTAAGALRFSSDSEVAIGSRIVNTQDVAVPPGSLQGFGQEVEAAHLLSFPRGSLLLPAVAWHVNSCGPPAFDTNVFFANAGPSPVRVSLNIAPGGEAMIVVDGQVLTAPFVFTMKPSEFRQHRIAAADVPLAVCLPPEIGAFVLEVDGGLAILGSVVDRSTGDARTVVPIAAKP